MGSSPSTVYTMGNRWYGWQIGELGEWQRAWRQLPASAATSAATQCNIAATKPASVPGPWRLTLTHPDIELGPASPGVKLLRPPYRDSTSSRWQVEYGVSLETATQGAAQGELHLVWQATVPQDRDDETLWQLTVENHSRESEVVGVAFPLLTSVRIPASRQEVLIYPFFAGLRFPDPVRSLVQPFAGPPGLGVIQAHPVPGDSRRYRLEQTYCGQISMPFLDYSAVIPAETGESHSHSGSELPLPRADAEGWPVGLSLACYDPDPALVRLRVDVVYPPSTGSATAPADGLADGPTNRPANPSSAGPTHPPAAGAADPPTNPGDPSGAELELGLVHPCRVRPNDRWQTPPTSVGLHTGDWHGAADRYRRFARPHLGVQRPRPAWVRRSDSLIAHYDFKWQDGRHTHTFADLAPLSARAQAEGVDHLFVAGWSSGGFDHLYPEYYPDLELGTIMDFVDGVRAIRQAGRQVTFYTNAALFGTDSAYHPSLGSAWAVRREDGSPIQLHFFQKDFTVSCRGVPAYQHQIIDTVTWLVGEAGATGVYLDCFAAIGPYACYAPEHQHVHPFTWNQDARQLLAHLHEALAARGLTPFLMIEGCGDLYAPYLTASLVHGWYYAYAYPEVFRYTFPEYLGVDMVYPSKGQRFRPAGISEQAYDQLHRTFVLGFYFWFYDQEDDRFCNFRTDPEMWAYIRQVLALRASVRPFLQEGDFLDDRGVTVRVNAAPRSDAGQGPACQGESVVVKRFRLHRPRPDLPDFDQPLPGRATGHDGELLAVWVRGARSPHTPTECWEDASAVADPQRHVELVVNVAQPNWEVWVQTLPPPGRAHQEGTLRWRPWPARLTAAPAANTPGPGMTPATGEPSGDARDPLTHTPTAGWQLHLPVPPAPLSVILLLPA